MTDTGEPPKKRGRPRKTDLAAKAKPGKPGRPKGTSGIMKEYQARMLNSPKSEKVLASIFDAALNDDHKHQAAAWKLIIDRIAPASMFEQEVVKGGGTPSISINITGVNSTEISSSSSSEDIIDGEVIDNND